MLSELSDDVFSYSIRSLKGKEAAQQQLWHSKSQTVKTKPFRGSTLLVSISFDPSHLIDKKKVSVYLKLGALRDP